MFAFFDMKRNRQRERFGGLIIIFCRVANVLAASELNLRVDLINPRIPLWAANKVI